MHSDVRVVLYIYNYTYVAQRAMRMSQVLENPIRIVIDVETFHNDYFRRQPTQLVLQSFVMIIMAKQIASITFI